MFDDSNRYLTRGIQDRLPSMIQLCLWNEICMNLMDALPLPIIIDVIDNGVYSTMLLAEEY